MAASKRSISRPFYESDSDKVKRKSWTTQKQTKKAWIPGCVVNLNFRETIAHQHSFGKTKKIDISFKPAIITFYRRDLLLIWHKFATASVSETGKYVSWKCPTICSCVKLLIFSVFSRFRFVLSSCHWTVLQKWTKTYANFELAHVFPRGYVFSCIVIAIVM